MRRLAVVFFVAAPLVIWIWSLVVQTGKDDAVKRIMFGYWQVRVMFAQGKRR